MSDSTQTKRMSPPTSAGLMLARHVVLLALLGAVYVAASGGGQNFLLRWAGWFVVVFGGSAVVAGVGLLFFPRRERGKTAINFRNSAWIFGALLVLGPVLRDFNTSIRAGIEPSARSGERAADSGSSGSLTVEPRNPMPEAALPIHMEATPEQTALMAKVRRNYPSLAAATDDEVVDALQRNFYPNTPRETIAQKLGVVLPSGRR